MRGVIKAIKCSILALFAAAALTHPVLAQSPAHAEALSDHIRASVSVFWSQLSRSGVMAIEPLIASDFSGVSREGRLERAEEIAALDRIRLTEFAIAGLRVTDLGEATASAEYCIVLKGRIDAVDLSGVYYMSDIWKKTAGVWLLWRRAEILAAP